MFHRPTSTVQPEQTQTGPAQGPARSAQTSDQSVVERYAKNQQEPQKQQNPVANENRTDYGTQHQQEEAQAMNNPQDTQNRQAPGNEPAQQQQQSAPQQQPQSRVDIPGGNFQRPNPQAAVRTPGTPYPGSYSGASGSYTAPGASADSGRKLVIGQGITLSGEIESCDHLLVEGTVEAALKGASVMDIAESGAFYGTVEIDEATIAGRFEGDLTVKGRLTIRATGSITGAVSYKELAVEAGATLDGKVTPLNAKADGKSKVTEGDFSKGKAKKAQENAGNELPFSDKAPAAAE